jgi:hypothetical protein
MYGLKFLYLIFWLCVPGKKFSWYNVGTSPLKTYGWLSFTYLRLSSDAVARNRCLWLSNGLPTPSIDGSRNLFATQLIWSGVRNVPNGWAERVLFLFTKTLAEPSESLLLNSVFQSLISIKLLPMLRDADESVAGIGLSRLMLEVGVFKEPPRSASWNWR